MNPQYPEVSAETLAAMPALRKQLTAELED